MINYFLSGRLGLIPIYGAVLSLLGTCAGYFGVGIETDDAFMDDAFVGSAPYYLYASRDERPKGDRFS